MKILHLCKLGYEGAGNAAFRHSEALSKVGYNSKLMVLKGTPKEIILGVKLRDRVKTLLARIFNHFIGYPGYVWHYMFGNYGIEKIREVRDSDIVYIHWINDFLGYKDIDYLLQNKKKVVWFLHDMWPITGGCHYALLCNNYKNECKNCPQLHRFKNIAFHQQQKKVKNWSNHYNLIIAAPSKWLADCAKRSLVFKNNKIVVCPNVVDTDVFKPKNKNECRKRLGLDPKKHYLMLSAVDANNIYKGFNYLCKAMTIVKSSNIEFLIVGNVDLNSYPQGVKDKMYCLGFIKEQNKIIDIYNAVDVFVISSIAENFPNVVIEAMACGVPIVGFATGGIPEQINHKVNGYLAKYKDSDDLAKGIDWVLNYGNYQSLCEAARKYAVKNCSYINVGKNHESILGK